MFCHALTPFSRHHCRARAGLVEVSPITRIADHVRIAAGTSVEWIAGAKRTETGSLMECSMMRAGRTETGTRWRGVMLDRLRRLGISELLVLLLVLPVAAAAHEPGYANAKIASPARTSRVASVSPFLPVNCRVAGCWSQPATSCRQWRAGSSLISTS